MVPKRVFEGMLRDNLPIDMVIDILVDRDVRAPLNLSTVLSSHADKVLDRQREVSLRMTRACIWNKAKQFYKACLHNPSQLRKHLIIEFHGEEGVDEGALRNEFFGKTLICISDEMFEGPSNRLVPKCHWGSDGQIELAGAAIAHSVLLGGPGFPCLHPAMYSHLALAWNEDSVQDMPCAEDIPINCTTADLVSLIEEVS